MNAEKKVIKHKFSVLELAETLGNISSACRQKGAMSTSVAFKPMEWKACATFLP
jgi:hypothetical protein